MSEPSHKLSPLFAGRVTDDSLRSLLRNGMTKKHRAKPRAGALPHKRESVLNSRMRDNPVEAETERLLTIKVRNFFRRAFAVTPGDIRSFQLCITNSGYHTVYLKDPPATDGRRP